ncbi:MAG: 5-methylthioadenosine/S-adenosylhomocysteine deaminase [Bryobacterales bacterium]|nr:5-methylthioadenosine/S-adenosylhomocysteine deaminase [Bryobacterales bacterium]
MLRLSSFFLLAGVLSAAPCDLVVSARYIVTMNGQHRVIRNGAVAIRGERIVGVGTRADIDRDWQPKKRIDRLNAIVSPGLINTHTHAAMSLFRGIADDLKLQDWLNSFIFPAEAKNVSADFVRWGTRLACLEMLLSGTTTFTDMYYFEDVVAETAKEAGMRGVLGETVIGFPVADAKTPADALKYTEKFLARFHNDPLVVPAVAPHALYTNSDETLKAARTLANKYNAPLLIHLSETRKENDDNQAKRHQSPTQTLNSIGLFVGRTVAAHCVWVDAIDMGILKQKNVGVAHCPSCIMKLASGAAPVVEMLRRGIPAGVGTDGPAGSNNDFDLMEEADLAAKLQKLIRNDPEVLPASQAFEMATMGGARVLGLEKEIGSLETGKRADLITIDLDAPNAVPMYDVYSQLVYALKGSNVLDVVVNGREIVRDRRVLTLDQPAVIAKAREYGLKVAQSVQQKH